jgi:Xaa-Pro aminopeptidase
MEARELGFSLVKDGAACSEVDNKVLTYLEKKGYGEQILHRTAHGFGITVHERPWLARGSKEVLRENMVISMEPGLYFAGKGGLRHSDTVLVTKNGYEILTEFPTDLESLTLPG